MNIHRFRVFVLMLAAVVPVLLVGTGSHSIGANASAIPQRKPVVAPTTQTISAQNPRPGLRKPSSSA